MKEEAGAVRKGFEFSLVFELEVELCEKRVVVIEDLVLFVCGFVNMRFKVLDGLKLIFPFKFD